MTERDLSKADHTERAAGSRDVLVASQLTYAGPLPHPAHLAQYEAVVKGAADRILRMAEGQSEHRRNLEKEMIASDIRRSYLGQLFGFAVALAGLYAATKMAESGHQTSASVVGGGTLVSLVAVFVYAKDARRSELSRKRREVSKPLGA